MLTHIALQTSGHAREICSEYAKFTAFSTSWYQQVTLNPRIPPEVLPLNLEDVVRELCSISRDIVERGCGVELDLTVQRASMKRYLAPHGKLARKIWQDERARRVWYPMEYDSVFR